MESINFSTYYRPKTFSEVVGQEVPKSVLRKIAMTDGISVRSVFLKGSYGSGKSTLCRLFGKAMNCSQFKKTGEICNECASCKEVEAANSQLYFEFDSSVAGNVDAIRALKDRLSYLPNGRRVVVFDETQSASKAALNALLKMVEDGIPNTMFVFASTEDILPTIKSRSVCLDITPIPHELIVHRLQEISALQNVEINSTQLDTIAVKSNGHMRDALSLLQLYSLAGDEALRSSYFSIVKFFRFALQKKLQEAELSLTDILTYPIVDIRNSLYIFIKNCYLAKQGSDLYMFNQSGVVNKIYGFTFSSVSQQALKDEMGIELYFRSFLDKVSR